MMRHRNGPPPDQSSSSEEDDVFSALSRKRKGSSAASISGMSFSKKQATSVVLGEDKVEGPLFEVTQPFNKGTVAAGTSSTKRHHGVVSDARKAKMDAVLLELEAEKNRATVSERPRGNAAPDRNQTRGSFVDPGDEYQTTNIFVGNLAPTITEEQVTDLFRQFGDLYSVKIMWPRTHEERSRNRHTGFVCFMNRQDAEDAMEACSEQDPFQVGRRLMMRWGKNVKKATGGAPIVKKGTGGVAPMIQSKTDMENHRAAAALDADLKVDDQSSIRVVPPTDKHRAHFISAVASFVAKDGEQFENMLIQQEVINPDFRFLQVTSSDATEETKKENVFYKWRVYSFCQGDGFHMWRTEPFTMFQPQGCTWIPPPVDVEAARQEAEEVKRKEEKILKQKQQRKFQNAQRGLATGRQLERARRGGAEAGARLTDTELAEFNRLFKEQLCTSRESICQAMAFCFEKSGAAKQVASMLKDLLLQTILGTSVETMTARLFLISDVLFNSQQPGIRNAFLYRDAIEQMSPAVFKGMGEFARDNFGRMSTERLASAINAIFAAWTNWGVYDPAFLDELQARFEGREIKSKNDDEKTIDIVDTSLPDCKQDQDFILNNAELLFASDKPRGDWTSVRDGNSAEDSEGVPIDDYHDGEPIESMQRNLHLLDTLDGAPQDVSDKLEDDERDGEPMDNTSVSGKPTSEVRSVNRCSLSYNPDGELLNGDPDGQPLDDDPDGQPLDDDDPEGQSLENAPDGQPVEEDPDGEPLEEDFDGQALLVGSDKEVDSEDHDGEPLEDDVDGEVL